MSVDELRFKTLLEYYYGKGVGKSIPWSQLTYVESGRSKRLKHVKRKDAIFATVRENGVIALTIDCARFLLKDRVFRRSCVVVEHDVENEVSKGLSVFCKHVASVGKNVIPGLDVAVVNPRWRLLAVGKAILPAEYMLAFKSGVAVRVRAGVKEGPEKDLSRLGAR